MEKRSLLKSQIFLARHCGKTDMYNAVDRAIKALEKEEAESMSNLEKAKQIIKENFKEGDCGLYSTRNTAGDQMTTIYEEGELRIDICYYWSYFEVFGLSNSEFYELLAYYNHLLKDAENDNK